MARRFAARALCAAFVLAITLGTPTNADDAGSVSETTNLDVWPLPKSIRAGSGVANVVPSAFHIVLGNSSANHGTLPLVSAAIERLRTTLFLADTGAGTGATSPYRRASFPPVVNGYTQLETLLHDASDSIPAFRKLTVMPPTAQTESITAENLEDASERYVLSLHETSGKLSADTEVGLLRGLETFAQLVRWMGADLGGYAIGPLPLVIEDAPRFAWRGLMVDTARHFLPVGHIFKTVDGMAAMKLNVFHWHFSDAQSFSYRSDVYPLLSEHGAYTPASSYSREQVAEVVQYAFARGIRVVPEFDVPAHSASWGKGYPELVAACEDTLKAGEADGDFEKQVDKVAMRPLADTTWTFLDKFFREVLETFPDPYIHLGTDEVNGDCWVADPDVAAFRDSHGYNWRSTLEVMFRRRLEKLIRSAAAGSPSRQKPIRFVLWDSESLGDIDSGKDDDESESSDNSDESEDDGGVALAQTWRFWEHGQATQLHRRGYAAKLCCAIAVSASSSNDLCQLSV